MKKYLEGFGAESISRQLTKLGIKTPKGKAVWCETTVRKILKKWKIQRRCTTRKNIYNRPN